MARVPNGSFDSKPSFYLPHHGVIRESSTTTKLRVVFNGSCNTINGKALNEILHTGPKLQTNIFDVILWLRKFKYIFSSDMEKMYRQINVHQDDWPFQRILWANGSDIDLYELTTVTYGLACAPFLALRCVSQLIIDEGHRFPLAIESLAKGRYVDDVFGGADSIDQAQKIARQVLDLCLAGGFPLRKWNTNNSDVLKDIPPEYRTTSTAVQFQNDIIHTLGLSWTPASDTFSFKPIQLLVDSVTKRSVLSKIAQFFDPIGLLSPVFIKSKIFLQELWGIKVSWDDPLPQSQIETWNQLIQPLHDLDMVTIRRWLGIQSEASIEIHGFCDASQLAIAAVVYVKTVDVQQNVTVSLVCSKTKVSPIKRLTIPRLELLGAVMLTKLVVHCRNVLNLSEAPCYLWTDSSIVTVWINNHPSKWKEFVHNRVCYIQESLPSARWCHVPGIDNPADCATRGLSPTELNSHYLWWNGPSWLSGSTSQWPTPQLSVPSDSTMLEERLARPPQRSCLITQVNHWSLLDRYSSLVRLLRITARCQRAIKRFQRNFDENNPLLTPMELQNAKKFWIRIVQTQSFQEEFKVIQNNETLPKSNPLVRLTPFIDDDGLLRVGGRLHHSALDQTAKHPYILPQDNQLSGLIIHHAHLETFHGSTQETLAYVRNEYWIIGGRNPVRTHILKCVTCTRYRHKQAQQLMGQLPPSRVNPSRPFLHAGVDYAGPITLKAWKGRTSRSYKSWIALFICFATSAIHLEIVTDYSTDAFLAAYKRFTGRRGICSTLSSDCGTNFKGADQELKKLFSSSSKEFERFQSLIANDGTSWKFNPPSAPHFGGKWEAGVKSMKFHLRRVTGTTMLTYEEISTVLIQIEAILNSRPMCPLTNDPDDLNALTPAHFLIGQPLTLIPEPNLEHLNQSRLSRWQHLTQMIQSFWSRWSKEYLQRHQAIYEWNTATHKLEIGTLVFIIDERVPPAKWPLGRIVQLHPGIDNRTRVVSVKTSTNVLKQPIVKLCPLNLTS